MPPSEWLPITLLSTVYAPSLPPKRRSEFLAASAQTPGTYPCMLQLVSKPAIELEVCPGRRLFHWRLHRRARACGGFRAIREKGTKSLDCTPSVNTCLDQTYLVKSLLPTALSLAAACQCAAASTSRRRLIEAISSGQMVASAHGSGRISSSS